MAKAAASAAIFIELASNGFVRVARYPVIAVVLCAPAATQAARDKGMSVLMNKNIEILKRNVMVVDRNEMYVNRE